jgi:drug/metabolite transporter (DMT)-like permease
MEASPLMNRLLLAAAAVLFSTGGAAIKATALTGWQVAGLRSGVAAVALLAGLNEARTRWSWRLAPVATAYAATLVFFVLATTLTTAANAIFLQSTAPFYLLLLGPWLLSEPVFRTDVMYALALVAGMTMLFLGTENPLATASLEMRLAPGAG